MSRTVIAIPSLKRCKLDDAEELEDLFIHGCVRRSASLGRGLDVERSGMLWLCVSGQLGFKWLRG